MLPHYHQSIHATSRSCHNIHVGSRVKRKLPLETLYVEINDSSSGWHAIQEMVVRGAPAIAIAAALSLAVEVVNLGTKPTDMHGALQYIHQRLDYLVSSRPTAVNLSDAALKLKERANNAALTASGADDIYTAYVDAAEAMLASDVMSNKAIGDFGASLILSHCKRKENVRILTHCNTGSLATAAYGTALGVIRSLNFQGKLETVYCTETRPFNQGSRLTAYELVYEKIPTVLIADSAAAALQNAGKVDAVVVGADRIASNGDTANKIGTYNLALAALHHGIPFYVAAPLTSIDSTLSSGDSIIIEERSAKELTHSHGGQGLQVAASGVHVWNPAFDVTPAKLITAIITDKGIIAKKEDPAAFDIPAFLKDHSELSSKESMSHETSEALSNGCKQDEDTPETKDNFYVLNTTSVVDYIMKHSSLASRLGGIESNWKVVEVGDGNLNFVYIIEGPCGSFVLKQSVPYVRCVGESWQLNSDRSYFEAIALKKQGTLCPQHVPDLYHFDRHMSIIIMQYLEPPHIILRKGLIKGIIYPCLGDHMSEYMAKTLFYTSLLAISTTTHRSAVAEFCGNVELCRLTEQVIFTEPYMEATNNRWTAPQLDEDVKALRNDKVLKLEVAELKAMFCERSQALIHGDLHSGSVMATVSSTKVIDPEFAFYGPIGFDVGAFLGNLLLAYFSQDGHADKQNDRQGYKRWILATIEETWSKFTQKFLSLWTENWESSGDAYPAGIYRSPTERTLAQEHYMNGILQDTLGFASAKMIRRIVGIAHVEDFEAISNPDLRAGCERRALNAAKKLMKARKSVSSIKEAFELISSELY
ncbi:hypothetical protein GOP47_0010089 [Adiantum capillus-veneris]|uniref:Methylthioribose-1-phosphate isomerase n=1 Tax=Adiantum capillus-veneris TaxID=13818 RepID=A0A9D4UU40_ADICA|nr:hypothetical protein GOP47_0010089 [Adiantum capillus-veneris]